MGVILKEVYNKMIKREASRKEYNKMYESTHNLYIIQYLSL